MRNRDENHPRHGPDRCRALLAGAAALAGLGLPAGPAQALPVPVPLNGAWPGCPNDHPEGPRHWCPGDPPVQTGNIRVNPVIWDAGVCHTYWYVAPGNCQQILGIFCRRA